MECVVVCKKTMSMNTELADNRIKWMDIAKAAAIWMVVTAHVLRKGAVTDYAGAAAVAVFFYLAGRTFSVTKNSQVQNTAEFIFHLVRRILIPYLFAGMISILIFRLLGQFAAGRMGVDLKSTSLSDDVLHLLFANSNGGGMKWNESLWFLPCYMCTVLMGYILERCLAAATFIKRNLSVIIRIAVSMLLAAAGIMLTKDGSYHAFVWHFETALLVFPVFEAGSIVKIYAGVRPAEEKNRARYLTGVLLIAASILIMSSVWKKQAVFCIRTGEMTGPLHGYLMILLLVAGMLLLAKLAEAVCGSVLKPVLYCGRHTLEILIWNKFPVLLIQILLPVMISGAAVLFNGSPTIITAAAAAVIAIPCMILCLVFDPLSMYRRIAHAPNSTGPDPAGRDFR